MNQRAKRIAITASAGAVGGFLAGISSGYGLPGSLLWAIGVGAIVAAVMWLAGAGRAYGPEGDEQK